MAINIVLFMAGLALAILGALMLYRVSALNSDKMQPLLDVLSLGSFQLGKFATSISSLFIIVGMSIVTVSCLEFHGAYRQNKCILLVPFDISLLLYILLEVTLIVLFFTVKIKVETELKEKMLTSLRTDYKYYYYQHNDPISIGWDDMFMELDCCAVNGVINTTNDFDKTNWCFAVSCSWIFTQNIPRSCCVNVDEASMINAPYNCHTYLEEGTFNTKGCYDELRDRIFPTTIIWVAIGIIPLEIMALILARLAANHTKNQIEDATKNQIKDAT
uniref:Tetraspanin-4-like n=1 Tax=Crassostrea virginica TaxID=6565 RepID=A0A8B8DJV7_CRAVI|nr:tetraspanin-4-like [Crassostrea virginica]